MHHPRIDVQDMDDTQRTIQEGGDRKMRISDAVVATLAQQLVKEDKLAVKETIAAALGQIAKPDALHNMCFDCLIKAFTMARSSEEATLKSMIVWTMGRLSTFETGHKFKKCLIAALQDPYWKVRAAACTSIANFGTQMAKEGIPILMKMLKEGQQNKQIVAETIILLGPMGEN